MHQRTSQRRRRPNEIPRAARTVKEIEQPRDIEVGECRRPDAVTDSIIALPLCANLQSAARECAHKSPLRQHATIDAECCASDTNL